jgi:hypothetical protein
LNAHQQKAKLQKAVRAMSFPHCSLNQHLIQQRLEQQPALHRILE